MYLNLLWLLCHLPDQCDSKVECNVYQLQLPAFKYISIIRFALFLPTPGSFSSLLNHLVPCSHTHHEALSPVLYISCLTFSKSTWTHVSSISQFICVCQSTDCWNFHAKPGTCVSSRGCADSLMAPQLRSPPGSFLNVSVTLLPNTAFHLLACLRTAFSFGTFT